MTTPSWQPSETWPADTQPARREKGTSTGAATEASTWERIGRQKRGSKFLGLPAIRVLWAAAEA